MDDERRARIERLRWHCRRALLELDLVFQRFWAANAEPDDATLDSLERLLELEDHELWSFVSGRAPVADPQFANIINRINATETKEY